MQGSELHLQGLEACGWSNLHGGPCSGLCSQGYGSPRARQIAPTATLFAQFAKLSASRAKPSASRAKLFALRARLFASRARLFALRTQPCSSSARLPSLRKKRIASPPRLASWHPQALAPHPSDAALHTSQIALPLPHADPLLWLRAKQHPHRPTHVTPIPVRAPHWPAPTRQEASIGATNVRRLAPSPRLQSARGQ